MIAGQARSPIDDPADDRVASVAIIPAYRAHATVCRVVERALAVVDLVVVVDDRCPDASGRLVEQTFGADRRVHVIFRETNGGVGAAMKSGIDFAFRLDAEFLVKIDADDQMNTGYVPQMLDILRTNDDVEMVKGNRFSDPATLRTMPAARLIGNAGLTLFVKISSGYWTIVDPTNGFMAIRASSLAELDLPKLADRYFFEIDLLCAFSMRKRLVAELEMPAIYGNERSSLSVSRVLLEFPGKLIRRFLRRIIVQYLVVEINVGSLCAAVGVPLLIAALAFGGHEWVLSHQSGVPRATGTVILALLLFITGFQLTFQALLYDVQFAAKTLKLRPWARRRAPARIER